MRVIGLMGKKGAGKDLLAHYLVWDHGWKRLAFGDAVKDVLLDINPTVYGVDGTPMPLHTLWQGWGGDAVKNLLEVRAWLQTLGAAIRKRDPHFWISILEEKVDALGPDAKIVVTDVRFTNEADWIEGLGGGLVRVLRPGLPTDPTNSHVSENELNHRSAVYQVENIAGLELLASTAAWLDATDLGMPDPAAEA